ncbi:MAG: right-handed parallel beta-helix repeat-containing protein [Myxococcota bacterium]
MQRIPMRDTPSLACRGGRAIAPLAAVILLAGSPAHAADGVTELNQTCAVQTGCLAGDAPGFPVTIAAPGNFVLTSDLDVRVAPVPANTTAIELTTGLIGTTVDLNGFSIVGAASCSFTPPCTNTGTGAGISGSASVRNGTIRAMGSDGILVSGGTVENVRAVGNGGRGIRVTFGSVRDSVAAINGGDGISVTDGTVADSVSLQNQGAGVSLTRASGENLTLRINQGVEASLISSRLGHSLLSANGSPELSCSECGLTSNVFVGCDGAACFGPGAAVQLPAGSNLCGNAICP